MEKYITQLKKLTAFPAVSGNEQELSLWLKSKLKLYSEKVMVDEIGNVFAIKGKPQITLFTHLDKVGYMISAIHKNYILAVPLKKGKAIPQEGTIWHVVILGNKKVKALIESKHDKLYIQLLNPLDKKHIQPGNFVALDENFQATGKTVISQGLDNKLGVLAAIEIFKKTSNIALACTTQEEAFHLGTATLVQNNKPKIAIVLDVTYHDGNIKSGNGSAICLKDNMLPSKRLVDQLITTANKYKIPFQLEVLESGGSDAEQICKPFGWIPFVFIGIPIKAMHTPHEQVDPDDLDKTIHLLVKFIKEYYE